MKDILNYYYQIIIDDKVDNRGYFSYDNHLFCLYKYERNLKEIDSLINLNKYMINENISINKIIFNIYHQPLTLYENNYYVLLLINYEYYDGIFKFISIYNLNNLEILKRNNWAYLWSMKIDYIEYQINHLIYKYPILAETVNYYIGLSENAISYFKMLKIDHEILYINHRRINTNYLYNPLELVIDYKVRDLSEYLKKCFYNEEKNIYEIKKYLLNINLSNTDYVLLYVRMLYPSFYFDIYDDIINKNLDEKNILNVTKLVNSYEELLYEIYLLIKRKVNIIGINWINDKFK